MANQNKRPEPISAQPISAHRRWINAFVARHQLAWDLTMAVLALAYVVLTPFEDKIGWHPGFLTEGNVVLIELVITLVFVAEFTLRFYAAESRRGYLRHHWIDLIALVPAVRALRFLRVGRLVYVLEMARFLRLGVLVRLLAEIERAGGRIRWIARHNSVHVFLALAVGMVVLGGALVWDLEHNSNAQFKSFGDAIWWAFATMATVGYGTGPETLWGRIVAGIIMLVGIGCFGLMSATVTTLFIERTHGPQVTAQELKALIEDLHTRLDRLERDLELARSGAAGAPPSAPRLGAEPTEPTEAELPVLAEPPAQAPISARTPQRTLRGE
jgi:voltage-gated potassium channel